VSAIDLVLPRLKKEEGFRSRIYTDTEGHPTIGYGCNLDSGLTERAASALLEAQVNELHGSLMGQSWYATLDDPRRSALLDIAFNAGVAGLLKFPRMLAAIGTRDWTTAANECRVTNPELAARYSALSQILLTGQA
jgi:lysozyme